MYVNAMSINVHTQTQLEGGANDFCPPPRSRKNYPRCSRRLEICPTLVGVKEKKASQESGSWLPIQNGQNQPCNSC